MTDYVIGCDPAVGEPVTTHIVFRKSDGRILGAHEQEADAVQLAADLEALSPEMVSAIADGEAN